MDRKQITASIAGVALVAASLFGAVAAAQGSGDVIVGDSPASQPGAGVEVAPVTVTLADVPAQQPPADTPLTVTYETAEYFEADEYVEADEYEEHEEDHAEYEDYEGEEHEEDDEYEEDEDDD